MTNQLPTPNSQPPLIVITGPTASGKTALALRLAKRWGGEIICADSRTVYRHMDIGTAKPTPEEQKVVPHWLLDVVDPGQRFTAADFQKLAFYAINDIRNRGKIPFLVGGTGLYIDSVVLRFSFGPEANSVIRNELEKMSITELQTLLRKQHIVIPENKNNKRYLIRSYEKNNVSISSRDTVEKDTFVVAIQTDMQELERRIDQRVREIFRTNIVQETQHLMSAYGSCGEAFTSNIYPIIKQLIEREISYEEAKRLSVLRDRQLAKKQLTWLKRHKWVNWHSLSDAEEYLDNLLVKYRDA